MPAAAQRSFSGGILSPILRGRADQAKYATGLRTCRNFIPIAAGPAVNRSGTEWICEVADSTKATRLLPFIFNDSQTYLLEFGEEYIRFIRSGTLLPPEFASVWSNVTSYIVGDLVFRLGHYYYCAVANTGLAPETHATQWRPMLNDLYFNIETPYQESELSEIRYIQSADVMTLFHPSHPPMELRRYADTFWTLVAVTTAASTATPAAPTPVAGVAPASAPTAPTGLAAVGGTIAVNPDQYVVSAWRLASGSEGVACAQVAATVGTADNVNPVALSWVAVAGVDGYAIYKMFDPTDPASLFYLIGITNGLAFTDDGISPARPVKTAPLSSTGAVTFTYAVTAISATDGSETGASPTGSCQGQQPTSIHPNVITWAAVSGASQYNVYKADASGVLGYIGTATGTTFYDPPTTSGATEGITQDTSRQPPTVPSLFGSTDDYPSVGTYFQQRLCAANSNNAPERAWGSRTGSFHDFSTSSPIEDDDAVIFTVLGEHVNAIRQLATVGGKLVIGTQDGIWTAEGDPSGVLTPTAINLRQQIYGGCSTLRLLAIENTALYVQARGAVVRDLVYTWQTNGYTGRNLTIFAPHLFESYSIVDWTYQQIPNSLVWAVRSDGKLLSLTYVHEQEVWGWAEHDTGDDVVEAVCCVPEGLEDALYLVVQRTINGSQKRYIERMHTRIVTDVAVDAFFVDSGQTYDGGPHLLPTLTLSGGTTWDFDELLTLTSNASGNFQASDVGKAFVITKGDDTVMVVISAYTSAFIVQGHATTSVPASLRGSVSDSWSRAVRVVTGLDHLEGRTVSALIDGTPQTDLVVSGGSVTLATWGSIIHVGLPIEADIESLDWEDPNQGTQIPKRKRITTVSLIVEQSRGFQVGEDEDSLVAYRERIDQSPGDPTALISDTIDIPIKARWNRKGRVFLRQSSPLPVSVLAVAITGAESE